LFPSVVASELEQIAADLLNQPERAPLSAAVVVDEAQDLVLASFSLLRALVGAARATEETRAWATAVLHGVDFDDLDGGCDSASDYRSLLHGDAPLVQGFEDPADEQRFLVTTLRQLRDEQQSLASTCVTARTNRAVEKRKGLLKAEGCATRVINADESDDPSDPALRLATMHRVKGLEFDQVFLPALDASQMPLRIELNKRPDQLSKDLFEQLERSLLHVAASRAKKRVVVSFRGKPSPFLRPA